MFQWRRKLLSGGGLNNFLKAARCLGLTKCFEIFHCKWNFCKFIYFSSIPSVALKRWHFPDNLGFKGKSVAKFLLRSHFFSISKNMTIKQQINHGTIQKICYLHNGIFHSIYLCHTFVTLSSPLCYSLKITNYGMINKYNNFFYMNASAYHVISKENSRNGGRKLYLDTTAFLDTHVYINSPYWQSSGIIIFLCKYHIVISDTLLGSWMCFSCCLL